MQHIINLNSGLKQNFFLKLSSSSFDEVLGNHDLTLGSNGTNPLCNSAISGATPDPCTPCPGCNFRVGFIYFSLYLSILGYTESMPLLHILSPVSPRRCMNLASLPTKTLVSHVISTSSLESLDIHLVDLLELLLLA